jgi:hypothetical protein
VQQNKRLEYCTVVRDLDLIRRGLWMREREKIVSFKKETLEKYYISHHTYKVISV